MWRSSFLFLLTVLVLSVPVQSQTQESTFFNNLRYRLVGPARGGRVTTVTGVPSQPKTFDMGVASGGLFRTTVDQKIGHNAIERYTVLKKALDLLKSESISN